MGTKKILVLGSTGGTGRQVVEQALARGHTVTAFARDPQKLAIAHERLRVATGDVTAEDAALADAMRGHDAVISALGVGQSFQPGQLIERTAPRVVATMERAGVRRLLWVSAFGVGDTFGQLPLVPRIFVRTLLAKIYADKAAGEAIVKRSALDWTVVYPSGLADGPPGSTVRSGERLELRGFPSIARSEVAAFLLDELEAGRFVRKGVLVSR